MFQMHVLSLCAVLWHGACFSLLLVDCSTCLGSDSLEWHVCRCVEDFHLHKQLYKGKASLLYSATCRLSNIPIALKLYRKEKLSNLNWFQVTAALITCCCGCC